MTTDLRYLKFSHSTWYNNRRARHGLPINRETYLTLDRWELSPELGPEEEAALPSQFRTDSDGRGIRWCRWCGAMVVPEIDHGVRTDDWIHIEDVGEPGGRERVQFRTAPASGTEVGCAEGNDMNQDSNKPKPQVRKSADVQKAALEYLRRLHLAVAR